LADVELGTRRAVREQRGAREQERDSYSEAHEAMVRHLASQPNGNLWLAPEEGHREEVGVVASG
jgi:hypothetical protein